MSRAGDQEKAKSAFEAALAQARAAAAKLREEGKLPKEEKIVTPQAQAAPAGAQQIVATGGQEYRDLGLGNSYRRTQAITDGTEGGYGDNGGGGGNGSFGGGPDTARFTGPSVGRGGGVGGSSYGRPQRDFSSEQFSKDSYNSNFQTPDGIGPQGHPNRERSPNRGGGGDGNYRSGRNNSEFTNARGEMPNRYHQGGGGGGGGGGHTGVSHGNRREGGMDPDQDYKIFVGGLNKETTTESLQAYFEKFGKIKYCQVKLDPATGASRGFGFILYYETGSVDNVIKNLPHTVDGKRVDAKRQHFNRGSETKDDKLFVGGVPSDFADGALADFFSPYGMVDAVERPRDQTTGMPKGFAFITFKNPAVVEQIVGQRWLTLPNGARVECKKQHHYPGGKGGKAHYADASGSMYMDAHGQAYVGEDWQSYDWSKPIDPNQQAAAAQQAHQQQQQQFQDPMMAAMMPGMEGLSQKEIKKSMKKMTKQWNQMMEMMSQMGNVTGSGEMSAEQMQQMMMMMGGGAGGGAGQPTPPDY